MLVPTTYGNRRALGAYLRRLREERGLLQRETADRLKLDQTFISRLESGGSLPSPDTAAKLAKLYDVDPGHLLRWIGVLKADPSIRAALLELLDAATADIETPLSRAQSAAQAPHLHACLTGPVPGGQGDGMLKDAQGRYTTLDSDRYRLRIDGDCAIARLRPGDEIVAEPGLPAPGGYVLVVATDDRVYLRLLAGVGEDGAIQLVSQNPRIGPPVVTLPADRIRQTFTVTHAIVRLHR